MSAPITGPPAILFYAIADLGCTAHFFSPFTPVCNKHPTTTPFAIHTPSGVILHSMHEADLDVPGLPPSARHGHIVPNLAMQPLISIGQLCDARCDVAFTANAITIRHNNNIILQGSRTPTSKLWEPEIQPPTPTRANTAIGSAAPADLITFAHAALFSPALSTLEDALQCSHLPPIAGLTLDTLHRYPLVSTASIKGHLDQQ